MLSEEQGLTEVVGLTVYDMLIVSHMVEKLLRNGLVTGKELSPVSSLHAKVLRIANEAVGVDLMEVGNKPVA